MNLCKVVYYLFKTQSLSFTPLQGKGRGDGNRHVELSVSSFPDSWERQKMGRSDRLLAAASQETMKKKWQTATLAMVTIATTALGARGGVSFSGLSTAAAQDSCLSSRVGASPQVSSCWGGWPYISWEISSSVSTALTPLGENMFSRFYFSLLPLLPGTEGSSGTMDAHLLCCCLCALSWPHGAESGIDTIWSVFPGTIWGTSSAFVGEALSVCLYISCCFVLVNCFFFFTYLFAFVSPHW